MSKLAVMTLAVLLIPAAALAAKPPPSPAKSPHVMYVLRGTLTAYTAASGSTKGSVSVLVKSANYHGTLLKSQTLTFPTSSSTKVVAPHGTAVTINDKGVVKVRGPKRIAATDNLATILQAATAFQILDQGASG